jgi:hypothetical protein
MVCIAKGFGGFLFCPACSAFCAGFAFCGFDRCHKKCVILRRYLSFWAHSDAEYAILRWYLCFRAEGVERCSEGCSQGSEGLFAGLRSQ